MTKEMEFAKCMALLRKAVRMEQIGRASFRERVYVLV